MKEIKYDLYRIKGDISFKFFLKMILSNPGFQYIYVYRKAKSSKILKKIFLVFLKLLSLIYHFQIPLRVEIGKGFYIGHFGNIIINPKVTLGKNINIHPGVTIGQTNRGKNEGVPIIGNEVWIGTNSVIVGKIKIGNNVLIAPNSYINFDVPDNSIVIGNPGRIIYKKDATNNYINNKIFEEK